MRNEAQAEVQAMRQKIRRMAGVEPKPMAFCQAFLICVRRLIRVR